MTTYLIPKKQSGWWLIIKILTAALIMLIFGTYVWLIQLNYDAVSKATKLTDRLWMPVFYALGVAAAGFSYDCAKTILFLTEDIFKRFFKHASNTVFFIICMGIWMLASAYLLSNSQPGARFAGQVVYCLGLGIVWYTIQSLSNAVDAAAGGK